MNEKQCPHCAEMIHADAIKCRYCKSDTAVILKKDLEFPTWELIVMVFAAALVIGELRGEINSSPIITVIACIGGICTGSTAIKKRNQLAKIFGIAILVLIGIYVLL